MISQKTMNLIWNLFDFVYVYLIIAIVGYVTILLFSGTPIDLDFDISKSIGSIWKPIGDAVSIVAVSFMAPTLILLNPRYRHLLSNPAALIYALFPSMIGIMLLRLHIIDTFEFGDNLETLSILLGLTACSALCWFVKFMHKVANPNIQ